MDFDLDPVSQRLQDPHGLAAPINQGGIRDVGAHPGEDLVQPIQWQVIVELRYEDMSRQAEAGHAARDWPAGRWAQHHLLAPPAGFLHPSNLSLVECKQSTVGQWMTFSWAVIMSSNSLSSSPTTRKSPPQFGQLSPGSSSRHSRGVPSETRGRRRGFFRSASPLGGAFAVSPSSCGLSSPSAMATCRSSSASSSCSISRSIFSEFAMRAQGGRHLLVLRLQGGDHRLQQRGIVG